MAIQMTNKLTVLLESSSTFTDYSDEALEYLRDSFEITLAAADFLYLGFSKPIASAYPEISTGNTNGGSLTVEYWNGTAWTAVEGLIDETKNFKRSGFILWDRNQDDEDKTTVNSTKQYWYRLTTSTTHSAVTIEGLNLVFASDQDLKSEIPAIDNFLPQDKTSFINYHVIAARRIVQKLRADGEAKLDLATGFIEDITIFDLLDVSQVRFAATSLALALIFRHESIEPNDQYKTLESEYMTEYNRAMNMFFLYLDRDNDGELDIEERRADNSPTLIRR